MTDKIPAKYLGNFFATQKYHEESDFYQSNHGEDDFGSYVNYEGVVEGNTDLCIADKNAAKLTTTQADTDSNAQLASMDMLAQHGNRNKLNLRSGVGQFDADLGMSFEQRPFVPPPEHSSFLISSVDASKPLLTTYEGLNTALKSKPVEEQKCPVCGTHMSVECDNSCGTFICGTKMCVGESYRSNPSGIWVQGHNPKCGLDNLSNDNVTEVSPTFKINNECYESYPCLHDVVVNGQPQKWWSGDYIAKYCKDNGWAVPPHFQEYMNWSSHK